MLMIEQDLPTLSEAKKALPNLGREAPPFMYRPIDLAPLRVPEYTDQEVITPVHLRVLRAADANHWWLDWPVGVRHNYHRARRGDAVKRLQVVQERGHAHLTNWGALTVIASDGSGSLAMNTPVATNWTETCVAIARVTLSTVVRVHWRLGWND